MFFFLNYPEDKETREIKAKDVHSPTIKKLEELAQKETSEESTSEPVCEALEPSKTALKLF